MSVFTSWPPASGDLMQIESMWSDILKEFTEKETRVHTEKDLWDEINMTFVDLSGKDDYVKSLISKIPLNLRKIEMMKGELLL